MARAKRFGIVCSTFNAEYTQGLLDAALDGLNGQTVNVLRVPGAFEIPLQVQRMAQSRRYAAVIALGVIWQGKTLHATEILRAVTDALIRIGLETDVPVIHQVLSIRTEAEAKARCLADGKLNRGREAAAAALALAKLQMDREPRRRAPHPPYDVA